MPVQHDVEKWGPGREPIKIAFVGRSKVGKTRCAEYLRVEHKFTRKNLVDPINKWLKGMYFYDRNQRIPWETKRALHDSLYKIDNDLLVNYLLARIELSPKDIVVDDVRYTSEALALKKKGFIIVRVTRPISKQMHVTKALGTYYSPGTLLLNEMYNKDFTIDLGVDYSVHNVGIEATKKALVAIIEDILTNRV